MNETLKTKIRAENALKIEVSVDNFYGYLALGAVMSGGRP